MDQAATMQGLTSHLELGMFGANGTGISMTKAPERWVPTWENNRDLVLSAEAAGLDFHVPFARWKGYGGESNPYGVTLDPVAWAAALLAVTRRITLFTTVHTQYTHPIIAAKHLATLDQIGPGRVGLNIVSGWSQDEATMFGIEQREHDERYEYTKEWLDVMTGLWTRHEPFDHEGKFFQLRGLAGDPKPRGGKVILMSAGASRAGRNFAMARCDRLFTILVSPEMCREEVASLKAAAREIDRLVDVYTSAYIVCRPTRKEAEEYSDRFSRELADWPATDNVMRMLGMDCQSFSPEHFAMFRSRFAGGHGNYPIVGDPDSVAEEIRRVRDAGVRGLTISFVDFAQEFPYFRDEVLPRLVAMGVRRPAAL
jgi:FMNH2-dependent dimethyl sulfone monooxygenase